jgi:hypothetical protein
MLNYIGKLVLVSLICGVLGYFITKEYVSYQLERELESLTIVR